MSKVIIDLTNRRFGRLTVLSQSGRDRFKSVTWLCVCDCGKQKVITGPSLRKGDTISCGCRLREHLESGEANRKHGQWMRPEYKIWRKLRQRCNNPNDKDWLRYGGRGISVCHRWNRFENFLSDMGERPDSSLTIERIDNDGNYEPSNCRWATRKEQARNRAPRRR